MEPMKGRILVTGGSGFIGSHLVDQLIAEGYETYIYDLREPTYDNAFTYIKGDILDPHALTEATKGMDAIYHLAAEANVDEYYLQPRDSTVTNTIGTIHVLEAVKTNKIPRMLFASTEWVYQGAKELIVDETTQLFPDAPDHIYTSSKIASELFIINYHKLYHVDFTIMRFGIPFGERARPQTVTPIFVSKSLKGEPITIKGGEENFRQFIYIKDLVNGCVACMQKNGKNQIINLNGKDKIKIIDIIAHLEQIMKKNIDYEIISERSGDHKGKLVRSEKAKQILGWEPKWTYPDALKVYYDWHLKTYDHPL